MVLVIFRYYLIFFEEEFCIKIEENVKILGFLILLNVSLWLKLLFVKV